MTEFRIWIYAALIGALLAGIAIAYTRPSILPTEAAPLTDLLFKGPRPILVLSLQVLFLALSAQLGMLINWYRSRGKLDFAGRYRFWPWAVLLVSAAAFGIATNSHRAIGEVIGSPNWMPWRPATVAWLLPFCVAALPISLFLDRDIRSHRSSLWTIRLSGVLWLVAASFEIYRLELQSQSWFEVADVLVPLFASATLFVGLWLHARIVAYVCPDPPNLTEPSAVSQLLTACGWIVSRLSFWKTAVAVTDDDESKPKRRRKKPESEEPVVKRKRRAPAKRSPTRTRSKAVEEEIVDDSAEAENSEPEAELESRSSAKPAQDASTWNDDQEQWDEDDEEKSASKASRPQSQGDQRFHQVQKGHSPAPSAPHFRRQTASWNEQSEDEEISTPTEDFDDENGEGRGDAGSSDPMVEQMKGLSKRQKRELRKQLRDQERARGR